MTTLCIIQARLSSKRLPRKVLMDIAGHPMLWHVVERAKAIRGVDKVVVACPLHDWADLQNAVDVPVMGWDGDEDDVLGRFLWVAEQVGVDELLRVTADCPLLLPEACEYAIVAPKGLLNSMVASEHEYSEWPDGTGGEAFSHDRLKRSNVLHNVGMNRQHFTERMRPCVVADNPHPERITTPLSVNTPADLDRVRAIYAHLAPGDYSWSGLVKAVRACGLP
jgi:spore coat polysaccharide biosynthesis protein SpsF